MFSLRRSFIVLLLTGLCLTAPAQAYVDLAPTLAKLISGSSRIAVVEVVDFNREKHILVLKEIRSLKGASSSEPIRQDVAASAARQSRSRSSNGPRRGAGRPLRLAEHGPGLCRPGLVSGADSEHRAVEARQGPSGLALGLLRRRFPTGGEHCADDRGQGSRHHRRGPRRGQRGGQLRSGPQPLQPSRAGEGRADSREYADAGDGHGRIGESRLLIGAGPVDEGDLAAIIERLRSPEAMVRMEAADDLRCLGARRCRRRRRLTELLGDRSPHVRLSAAAALLQIDLKESHALEVLARGLASSDLAERRDAAEFIGLAGPAAAPLAGKLAVAVKDPEESVRIAALHAISTLGPTAAQAAGAVAPLLDDPGLAIDAADALGCIGRGRRPALKRLAKMLSSDQPAVRWAAVRAMSQIGGEEAHPVVDFMVHALHGATEVEGYNMMIYFALLGPVAKDALPTIRSVRIKNPVLPSATAWAIEADKTLPWLGRGPFGGPGPGGPGGGPGPDVGTLIYEAYVHELGDRLRPAARLLARKIMDGTAGDVPDWGYKILTCAPGEVIEIVSPHLADADVVQARAGSRCPGAYWLGGRAGNRAGQSGPRQGFDGRREAPARLVFAGNQPVGQAPSEPESGWKARRTHFAASERSMTIFAVVPIFTSAGVALLPTIVAALASLAALLLRPRELLRLARRRPVAAGVTVGAVAMGLAVAWSLASAQSPRSSTLAGSRVRVHCDWERVAEEIIARQQQGERAPAPQAVDVPPDAALVLGRDFSRGAYQGGPSPLRLKPLWCYHPDETMFLSSPAVAGKRVLRPAARPTWAVTPGCWPASTPKPASRYGKSRRPVGRTCVRFQLARCDADRKYLVIGQGLHSDRDCSLLCFDAATGLLRWAVKTPLHVESSPAILGNMAVVGAAAIEGQDGKALGDPGFVLAVRIDDGKELWRQPVNDPESSPAIDDGGTVYIGSGCNGNAVVAIRSESDEQLRDEKLDRIVWHTPWRSPPSAR